MATELTIETINLKHPKGGIAVQVSAIRTAVSQLVVTPALSIDEDGAVTFSEGYLHLTHAPTGRSLTNGSCKRLQDLATKLATFDWSFTEVGHFTQPENEEERDRILAIIREWEMETTGGPTALYGDTDDVIEARKVAPAATLLREHIDGWLKHDVARRDINYDTDRAAYYAAVMHAVDGYGVIYLLAVLRKIDPAVADAAARDLVGAWDCGEFGEWVYQWGEELAAGKPLTLHGIPTANPLADFS